jgi:hypothetical protein
MHRLRFPARQLFCRDVVDQEAMVLSRACYERAKGSFVIKSKRTPLPSNPEQYYRCEPTFEQVNVSLREHGISGSKPLQTLGEESCSLLTRSHGIHVASRALRHAALRTTSEHYSDSTARVTPGIGCLVANPKRAKFTGKTSKTK